MDSRSSVGDGGTVRALQWDRGPWIRFAIEHGHDAPGGIVARDVADCHERAERIEQVLLEGGARKIGLQPLHRPRVPGLSVHVLISVRSCHTADGDLRGELAWQDDNVTFPHCKREGPELSREITDSTWLPVR